MPSLLTDHTLYADIAKDLNVPLLRETTAFTWLKDHSLMRSWVSVATTAAPSRAKASATARPIAASRVGGIPDIVLEDTTGLLFEAGSEDGLAEAVCRLLGDRELGDRLGAAARDRACSEFSATVWLDRLRALYLQAMGDRR